MVFDDKPFCIANEAQDLMPDYFRMDFCYRPYTADKVKTLANQLIKFNDAINCIKGNFIKNNI